jgi:uncharacterized protein YbjT (DUF2867 family)
MRGVRGAMVVGGRQRRSEAIAPQHAFAAQCTLIVNACAHASPDGTHRKKGIACAHRLTMRRRTMKVLLIGAHGRTGRLIARRLHDETIPFRALLRKSAHKSEFIAMGAEIVLGDLNNDFYHTFDDVTHVIYAAGSSDNEGIHQERAIDRDAVMHAADYAKRRRVQQIIVVSALSAYWPEKSGFALRHYSRMKREADAYVMKRGVPFTILRPGPFDETAHSGIAFADEHTHSLKEVSRDQLAHLALRCITSNVTNRVIGFTGGNATIDALLSTATRHQFAPTSR